MDVTEATQLAAVRDEYRQLAPAYDRRWRKYLARTAVETLAQVRLAPGLRVVDVGCGTGYLLARLAEREPALVSVGIDPSAEMLRLAKQRGIAGASFLEASAENMPLADESVDTVVSTSAFHYWYDPRQALAEIYRILRPGGRFVLTDWCDDFFACRLCTGWLRLVGRPQNLILGSRACTDLVREARFADVSVRTFRADWLWGMMTVSGHKSADGSRTASHRIY